MTRLVIAALRALIVVIVLAGLFAQVRIVPFIARGLASDAERPEIVVPYAFCGILAIACGQLVLVAIWALLSKVRRDAIFSESAYRWVDVILAAGITATATLLALALHVALVVEPPLDAPGLTAFALGGVICAAAFVLLMIVMRGLLRSATGLRSELAEVV
ncbi:hypothetical protein MSA03_19940 [Microbacterium saccharophilum]|nr:DUF2975 domain-containing protein [Microbacterium saccharophilum]GEP48486.1 hypothetical protein MSA03_19940 [Microbacterium saccharophilum]